MKESKHFEVVAMVNADHKAHLGTHKLRVVKFKNRKVYGFQRLVTRYNGKNDFDTFWETYDTYDTAFRAASAGAEYFAAQKLYEMKESDERREYAIRQWSKIIDLNINYDRAERGLPPIVVEPVDIE